MTLWNEVSNMRGQIKHAPEQVDLQEVRQLLGQVEDALEVLVMLTSGAEIGFMTAPPELGDGWEIRIITIVDDRRPLLNWMANG